MFEAGEAAEEKYGYILDVLPRRPQDDIETWEYHNLTDTPLEEHLKIFSAYGKFL